MKTVEIKKIIALFKIRYSHENPNLSGPIRRLLATAAGVILIAGIADWLEERLKTPLTPLGKGE
jgi:hypothetical protein